ncbi:MAG: 2-alkenal reductase, partial [Pseudomonadota bacterium]
MPDRFLVRLFWLTLATAFVILLWRATPDLFGWFAGAPDSTPRLVTPRGELAADEKATIELFEKSKNS